MNRFGSRFTVAAAVAVLALLVTPALAEETDLSGTWQINEDLSEDPRQKMQEAMESRRGSGGGGGMHGGGGGMRGGGGGMRGGGGGMRGGGGGGDMPGGRGGMMGQGSKTLTITQAEAEVTIYTADGRQRWLHTDGRKEEREGERGQAEVQARWKDGQLVITTKADRGTTITETYELKPDADQLRVAVKMQGSRMGTVSFKRVYDAVKGTEDDTRTDDAQDPSEEQ